MVFNLKGLMESVRPTQIGIGALETIQNRFKEDRELDQQRLSNTIDSAGLILEDANEQVALINKRDELFAQTAEMYGPSVADYLSQNKTFALYDGVNNVNALKDIDSKAREATRIIAEGGFETSENPYQLDTRNALLGTLDKVESELQSLNNIPDKTGKVAIRKKELEKIKSTLGTEVMPGEGVKVSAFPTTMSQSQRLNEQALNVATAMNLGVDIFSKEAMNEIGFNPVSVNEADEILGIANNINDLQNMFTDDVKLRTIILTSSNLKKDLEPYQKRYEEILKQSISRIPEKDATSTTDADENLPIIKTAEEYEALPSGTIFLNADGTKAKKP